MGRAAAVRAATKSKTDAKKAKINAVYGKRIIMAVKQGGGPDPEGNRLLADVIKQAKANNVPVDVSTRVVKGRTQPCSFPTIKSQTVVTAKANIVFVCLFYRM
jgi:transcriptional/translational regulatory protein YebC/TACO1